MSQYGINIYVCRHVLEPERTAMSLEDAAGRAAGAAQVTLQTVPCSGKTDVVYILRAFEGGAQGLGLITCPPGKCRNCEGNYRAQVRFGHAARILEEIGLGSERLAIAHPQGADRGGDLESLVVETVSRLAALPPNPVVRPGEPAQVEQQ